MMRIMISARNQFVGMVENVKAGAVNGVVTIKSGNEEIKADITMESINQLGLKEGVEAAAVVKATSVMFASGSEPISNLSARNQFAGIVSNVREGAVNGISRFRFLTEIRLRVLSQTKLSKNSD